MIPTLGTEVYKEYGPTTYGLFGSLGVWLESVLGYSVGVLMKARKVFTELHSAVVIGRMLK